MKKNFFLVPICGLFCLVTFATESEFVKIDKISASGVIKIDNANVVVKAKFEREFYFCVNEEYYALPQECNKFFAGYDLGSMRLIYSVSPKDKSIFATATFTSFNGQKKLSVSLNKGVMSVSEFSPQFDKELVKKELFSSPNCAVKLIKITAGDEFEIELTANPTTGYTWQPHIYPTNESLKLISSEFIAPDSALAGAPGKMKFKFQTKEPNCISLNMEYRRVWEKNVPPVEVKKFLIVIERKNTFSPQI